MASLSPKILPLSVPTDHVPSQFGPTEARCIFSKSFLWSSWALWAPPSLSTHVKMAVGDATHTNPSHGEHGLGQGRADHQHVSRGGFQGIILDYELFCTIDAIHGPTQGLCQGKASIRQVLSELVGLQPRWWGTSTSNALISDHTFFLLLFLQDTISRRRESNRSGLTTGWAGSTRPTWIRKLKPRTTPSEYLWFG
jgi:hypothetical protein